MRVPFPVLAAFLVAFAGCSERDAGPEADAGEDLDTDPTNSTAPTTHFVRLVGTAFEPRVINITAGDAVVWEHADGDTPHNVESSAPAFDSHPTCKVALPKSPVCMATGDRFQFGFLEPATVEYLCELHSGMTGTIHVVGAPATNSTGTPPDRPGRP